MACQPNGLSAVRPGSTMARAPVSSHNKGNYKTVVLKKVYPLCHGDSFYPLLVRFDLQTTYRNIAAKVGIKIL